MNLILSIALGGAIGSVMRYFSVAAWTKAMGEAFPYGTLFVNVLGSFIIGVLAELMLRKWQVTPEMRAFLITGILGGFTTFSAFSLDVFKLAETGHAAGAVAYVTASLTLSLSAVFGGAYLVRHMAGG
jgi:CrcB protein